MSTDLNGYSYKFVFKAKSLKVEALKLILKSSEYFLEAWG